MQEFKIGVTYLVEQPVYSGGNLSKITINDLNDVYVKFTIIGNHDDFIEYMRIETFNKHYTIVCTL